MNINEMIRDTIKRYYNISKDERTYIEGLLDDKKAQWTKNQLIVSLLIFNKSKELKENEIEELKLYIEDNLKLICKFIKKNDIEYKESLKVK
jgi:predicted transcriptional regulator